MTDAPSLAHSIFFERTAASGPLPLVVDLDGGLLRRDPASSLLSAAQKTHPLRMMKDARLAARRPDLCADDLAARLPNLDVRHDVNADVVELMRIYGRFGGDIVVISRASVTMAERIVAHLGLRARIYGSDKVHRLDRLRKARVVEAVFGPHGFVFVGPVRHREDICLAARRVIGVGGRETTRARLLTFGVSAAFLPAPDWISFDLRAGALIDESGADRDGLNLRVSRDIWESDQLRSGAGVSQASDGAPMPGRRRA